MMNCLSITFICSHTYEIRLNYYKTNSSNLTSNIHNKNNLQIEVSNRMEA